MGKPVRNLILMTGTPLTTPADVYGYCQFVNRDAYTSQTHFNTLHVAERGFFDEVTEWQNEILLQQNFLNNGARVFRREVDPDLPPVTYEPIFYKLHPDHKRLYDKLAEEALLEVENSQEINFITTSAINSNLQQIIVGYDSYFEDPKEKAKARNKIAAFELLDNTMQELGNRKLIVFAYYQKAIESLLDCGKQYNAVAINGRSTAKAREASLEAFVSNPECRLLIAQPLSAGSGLDMLKDVCSDILFLELPMIAKDFIQAVGRIDRNGQKERCHVRLAVAEGTLQVRRQKALLDKDSKANEIQKTYRDLRDWIYGK